MELVAVPLAVVTVMRPVLAPPGTTAVMVVAFTTEKEAADKELNATAVAPVKLVPVMVTVVPDAPDVGENEAIVGAFGEDEPTVPVITKSGPTVARLFRYHVPVPEAP